MTAMPERHRFIRGMRSWVGMRQIGVPYERPARAAGEPKYTFSKLVLLAADGFLSFTEAPLRVSTWTGAIVAACSFLWGLYIILWRIFGTPPPELVGWATLASGMFFLGGVQLVCLGILGEYIARIHNEVKGRPVYVVGRKIGFDGPQRAPEANGHASAEGTRSTVTS
jgi:dolichol-phosphate mannosyltransferase